MKSKSPRQRGGLASISSKPWAAPLLYFSTFGVFLVVILGPSILGIVENLGTVGALQQNPALMSGAFASIGNSFLVATIVTIIDLSTGLPLAWIIARRSGRALRYLDILVDLPLVMPTVALGTSILLFAGITQYGAEYSLLKLTVPGLALILMLHVAFTYPYIVRTLVGVISDTDLSYEVPARTLGAPSFTASRTVSLPLLKAGIVAAIVLSFARSLSETGATSVVAGSFQTGPVFINDHKALTSVVVLVSGLMILTATTILTLLSFLLRRLKLPLNRAWPTSEKTLSKSGSTNARNLIGIGSLFLLVLTPSFYLFYPAPSGLASLNNSAFSAFWISLGVSLLVATLATLLDIGLGLPIAVGLARKRYGSLTGLVDLLVNIPILVPSIAIGASLRLFWTGGFASAGFSDFWLLVFAHLSFTFPFVVRAYSASVGSVSLEAEEVARTLGANPFRVFTKITFPLTKAALVAGAIMAFTRSVGETGATTAVLGTSTSFMTAPVLIVGWIRGTPPLPIDQPSLASAILVLTCVVPLFILRKVVGKRGARYA